MGRYQPSHNEQLALAHLRQNGWHVERQGTYDNRVQQLALAEHRLRWAEDEKSHHEQWLAGILDESRRLQQRFNAITAALAASGVEWATIAALIDPPAPSADLTQPNESDRPEETA